MIKNSKRIERAIFTELASVEPGQTKEISANALADWLVVSLDEITQVVDKLKRRYATERCEMFECWTKSVNKATDTIICIRMQDLRKRYL